MPNPEDINLEGLDMTVEDLKKILDCDKKVWLAEAEDIENFYATKFGDTLPKELYAELKKLKKNLRKRG